MNLPYPFWYTVSRACVMSCSRTLLPIGIDRIWIYLHIGKKGRMPVGEDISKGARILRGGQAGPGSGMSRMAANSSEETCGSMRSV